MKLNMKMTISKRFVNTIAVAMSGGIDSSVTALLLKQKGYSIIGIYMRNWDNLDEAGSKVCSSDRDYLDMSQVCAALKIPAYEVEFIKEYWNDVFSPLLNSYQDIHQTPNPDTACNRYIKFKQLRQYVKKKFGINTIATGHYAQILPNYSDHPSPLLFQSKDLIKDQSYFLSTTRGIDLVNTLFPVGNMLKSEVKALAAQYLQGLQVLSKPESMGVCFVGKRNFSNFLGSYIVKTPGRFIDIDTFQVVGTHDSIELLTIGQGARISGATHPYYVVDRPKVTQFPEYANGQSLQYGDALVACGQTHPALYSDQLYVKVLSNRNKHAAGVREEDNPDYFNWIMGSIPVPLLQGDRCLRCWCRVRHSLPLERCTVTLQQSSSIPTPHNSQTGSATTGSTEDFQQLQDNMEMKITFDRPQRALTRGQIAALYIAPKELNICLDSGGGESVGEESLLCLGGGPICNTGPSYFMLNKPLPEFSS